MIELYPKKSYKIIWRIFLINFKSFMLNLMFSILWIFAIVLFFNIIYLITTSSNKGALQLLVPLGVLISAGLASVSLMKSIHNTNCIKEEGKKDKKDNATKYLYTIIENINYELSIFEKYFETTKELNIYSVDEIKNNITKIEMQQFIVEYYKSEYNKLFIRNLGTTINSLQNLINKLEDKDIVYYTDALLYDTVKTIQFFISQMKDCKNRNKLISTSINMEEIEIEIQKFIELSIGLKKYHKLVEKNIINLLNIR
jgi:hypothetical protein